MLTISDGATSRGIRFTKDMMDSIGLNASDIPDDETFDDMKIIRKTFRHKSFEERMTKYNNEISVCDFDWGQPLGREML